MMRNVFILGLAFVLASDLLAAPQQAIATAYADCQKLPNPQDVRYLDATHLPPNYLVETIMVLSGHVNGMSTESDINVPTLLDGGVLRVNIRDYNWDPKVWEKLLDVEPYYHALIEQEYGVTENGRWRRTETRQERAHVGGKSAAELIKLTQSQVPIVRADWFFNQTAIQAEREGHGHYDFLGIKDQKSYEEIIGFSQKVNDKARNTDLIEAIEDSGIVQEARRIRGKRTSGGMRYWVTFDQLKGTAKEKNNPLRVMDDTDFKFAASEAFGPLPNDLWVTALWDNQGKLQSSVPDAIAHAKSRSSNDGRLHTNLDCIGCHMPHGGLQPIGEEWFRSLYDLRGPLRLQSPDYAVLTDLRKKYLRDMMVPLELDRQAYARAIFQASGLQPAQYAVAYLKFWERYEEGKVDLQRACEEWGVEPKAALAAFDASLKRVGHIDTVIGKLMVGGSIKRRQFEESFQLGAQILGGVKR